MVWEVFFVIKDLGLLLACTAVDTENFFYYVFK